MSLIRKFAIAYAFLFFFVVALDFIPGLTDQSGNLFGLFALDLYDNSLHALSGLWALIAGLVSTRQSTVYFKLFGSLYFLDGILGLFLGNAFLDFGIFQYGIADYGFVFKFLTNIPHILIGGVAVVIGFYLSKKAKFVS